MASELRVNTLKDASGNNSVGMSYVANGSAKAWNNINGTGTIAIRDSFNVSGITDEGTGRYLHSVTNSFSSANNVANGFVRVSANYGFFSGDNDTPFTTSSFRNGTLGGGAAALVDALYVTISLLGDLA